VATVMTITTVAFLLVLVWLIVRAMFLRRLERRSRRNTYIHCMIDLETYALTSNAYIRSIGACFFDENGVVDSFYESCDGSRQDLADVEDEAVNWWRSQSDEAKAALANPQNNRLEDTLNSLSRWITAELAMQRRVRRRPDLDVCVWGNGSDFDLVILTNAYRRCGIDIPWKWYNVRCYRTLKSLAAYAVPKPKFVGARHDALNDALFQAEHASMILKHLRRSL
jgi:hypothetical protein